jgi:hypothetical protein
LKVKVSLLFQDNIVTIARYRARIHLLEDLIATAQRDFRKPDVSRDSGSGGNSATLTEQPMDVDTDQADQPLESYSERGRDMTEERVALQEDPEGGVWL